MNKCTNFIKKIKQNSPKPVYACIKIFYDCRKKCVDTDYCRSNGNLEKGMAEANLIIINSHYFVIKKIPTV